MGVSNESWYFQSCYLTTLSFREIDYMALVISEIPGKEHRRNDVDKGKPKYWEKILSTATLPKIATASAVKSRRLST